MNHTPTDELEDRLAELLSAALEPAGAWARQQEPVARSVRRPWQALGAVAACAAVLAGGLGVRAAVRDDTGDDSAPVFVADEPTTTSPPSTTTGPAVDPEAPPAPTPVVAATAAAGDRTAVTGHGDGFVAIVTRADGTTVVRTSADGATWSEHAIDLGGTVDHLVSDGSTLTAVGVQGAIGEDRLPSVWRSTDGGATWTGGPMPLPDLPLIDDSLLSIGNTSVAAGDAGVLVTAVAYRWLDLFALVERQTGEPLPEGSGFDVDGTTVTVTPPDGEPFTVDASGVDPRVSVLTDPVEVGVSWTLQPDGSWRSAVDPFGSDALPYASTWGPAGYLAWTPGQLWTSSDGEVWDLVPAPQVALANLPALASDGERYLLVAFEGELVTSTDLRTWERHGRLPVEDESLVHPLRVVGGGAGFVSIVSTWSAADPADRPPVVVERDGRRLTLDRVGRVVTVVEVATGAELLRWEGDLDHMPPEVFAFVDGEVRYLNQATGEVVFRIGFDEMNQAVAASDEVAEAAIPASQDVLLWSPDGVHWEQRPLGDSSNTITPLAVSDTATAVLPLAPPTG